MHLVFSFYPSVLSRFCFDIRYSIVIRSHLNLPWTNKISISAMLAQSCATWTWNIFKRFMYLDAT